MKHIFLTAGMLVVLALNFCKAQNVGEAKSSGGFCVMSYNVRNCKGMDDVVDYARVAAVINKYQPVVVALQELDSATQRSNGVVVLDTLAALTGLVKSFSPSIDFQGGKYGVGLLSAEKPIGYQLFSLPGREEKRSLLVVEFADYFFCSTHWTLTREDRITSAHFVNQLLASLAKPVLIAGDFNAVPDSPEIALMLEKWVMLNSPDIPTIPSENPERCIDFIFGSRTAGISWEVLQTSVPQEPVASDHLPVLVRVRMHKE